MRRIESAERDETPLPRADELAERSRFGKLELREIWRVFRRQHYSFWAICGYLFVEYVRPQSIIKALDFAPWASFFLVLAILGWFSDPKRSWVRDPMNLFIILFLSVVILSSYNAYNPSFAFSKLEYAYTWVIIYFVIINTVNSDERLFLFIGIFAIASFKISASLAITWAARGFSFTDWGLMGPPGPFQNSGELAIQMLVYWPIALAIVELSRGKTMKWKKMIVCAMPITAWMVILGASSRGGQLALLVQLCLQYWKKIFRIRVVVVAFLVGGAGWALLPDEQKERFYTMGSDETSMQRLLYWERGIDMLSAHPVLGVGYSNFPLYYEAHFPQDILFGRAEVPHNIFVQVGSELGYAGLFCYIAMILRCLQIGWILNTDARGGGAPGYFSALIGRYLNASLIGFLVAGQFVSVVYYPFMWIHISIAVAILGIRRKSLTGN